MEMLLLARLSLSPGNPVSADTLVDELWDEAPPATARKILQKYVSGLRRRLGSDRIRSEHQGYALAIPRGAVDVGRFERLTHGARAARTSGLIGAAERLYEEALKLWRGAPLAGLATARFVIDEIDRLEELKISALEEQMEIGLALGNHRDLAPRLSELVTHHPFRERLWAAFMTALYRSGRQADALAAYRRLHRTMLDELGVEPSRALTELEERILLQDPDLATPEPEHEPRKLPLTYTSFVGRATDISKLSDWIETARLVTLIGPGGSGKTRLALEFARATKAPYPDGRWFVDLASTNDPGEIAATAAAVLGLAPEPGITIDDTLVGFLSDKHLLLILDNCEHLITSAASLANDILRACPSVSLLVTSREPLGLTGEVLFPVGPLPIPDPGEDDGGRLGENPSARLFVDRAQAADPGIRLTHDLAPTVTEICRRLDGIPLAIELAARQLHVVGPHDLRRGLLDELDLLAAPGEPDARHRTMEAAIEWGFRLLDEEQRSMFEALSVFAGSFTAEAVERVCATELAPGSGVRLLTALAGRSMVLREPRDGNARYRLLEPMRAFAVRQASIGGRIDELHRAHAEWVLELFLENDPIVGPDERERLRRLSAEHHHLTAALDWASSAVPELALRLLVAAAGYTQMVVYRFGWADDANLVLASSGDVSPELRAAALAAGALILAENLAAKEAVRS
jgi:predicted ATPase/DNA-binding SARP family transcriptional activator